MTSDEYQAEAIKTASAPKWDEIDTKCHVHTANLTHAVMGLSTEVGEIVDAVKKHFFYGKPLDEANLMEECGDILWYVALLLDTIDIRMSECMKKNVAKLQARYPKGYTAEKAINRDLEAERAILETLERRK